MTPYIKTILRSIRGSLGRFMAILAIIAMGVGFMGGLVQTYPSFMLTGRTYISGQKMFDMRALSTIGFDEDDIERIRALKGVADAEGSYFCDSLAVLSAEGVSDRKEVRVLSVTRDVNILKVEAGRLPEDTNEIVLDGYMFGEDVIGQTLTMVNENGRSSGSGLVTDTFTVVGTVRTPVYLDFQRGTTDIGSGRLSYFAFVLPEAFDSEYYSECYIYCGPGFEAYTDEYDDWADAEADALEDEIRSVIDARFEDLLDESRDDLASGIADFNEARTDASGSLQSAKDELSDARAAVIDAREQLDAFELQLSSLPAVPPQMQEAYDEALAEYEDGVREYNEGLADYYEGLHEFEASMSSVSNELDYMSQQIANAEYPEVYVLGRDTNVGYLSFNNDAGIVKGIANVFPLFFFALAALVCSTTMQRMVSDERGEAGTMRALGYTDTAIIMKYVIYAGSASVIGAAAGYQAGLHLFPFVIWDLYDMMYGFADLILERSAALFIAALAVSLFCSAGVAFLTAASELRCMPAELIRPKAPASGKKILLEKMTFIWRRLKFNDKVSLRNVFRFKKRMLMMITGIAGGAALLITGFGLKDSITDVVDLQYDNITTYRLDAVMKDGVSLNKALSDLDEANGILGTSYRAVTVRGENVTHTSSSAVRDVTLYVSSDEHISEALKGRVGGTVMPWPSDGQIAISSKLASKTGLKEGDLITLGYGDEGREFTLEIAYVFENYIYHYAFMNEATYEQAFGRTYRPSGLFLISESDAVSSDYDIARELTVTGDFSNMGVVDQSRQSFSSTMERMNVIVVLLIGCAAALSFIVLFNLNNINITERIREIATIEVLGFTQGETGAYFFRENFILVFMGYIFGIPLGILLHRFVIDRIEMDMVTFEVKINPVSYLLSLLLIILFSVIVDLVMRVKISRIDMAESLKSAE